MYNQLGAAAYTGSKRVWQQLQGSWAALVFIGLVCFVTTVSAQSRPALYRQTVESFNITAVRFVLENDTSIATRTRALSLAQSMERSEFPYDELVLRIRMLYGSNSRTEALYRRLDTRRGMYNENREVDEQLRDVINFIVSDQTLRNKPYQTELKMRLDEIRAQATAEVPVLRDSETAVSGNRLVSQDLQSRVRELERQVASLGNQQAVTANVPTWLTALVILLALLSLFNLYLNISTRYGALAGKRGAKENDGLSGTPGDINIQKTLQDDYRRLDKKIDDLKKDVERLVRSAVISDPAGDRRDQPSKPQNTYRQPRVNPLDIDDSSFARSAGEPGGSKNRPGRTEREPGSKDYHTPRDRDQRNRNKPTPEASVMHKRIFYAEYPKEEGFVSSQLRDTPDRRSLYKISYKEGDSVASFTIVDDPAIHEYALQNRERLLKDACEFEISSSKHARIEVIAPGQLRKNGTHWTIVQKAQIRFI
jgi:hypothetical protein